MEKLKGSLYSKSAWFGVVVALLGLLEQVFPTLVTQLVPAGYTGGVMAVFGLVVWTLRWVTVAPLEEKIQ